MISYSKAYDRYSKSLNSLYTINKFIQYDTKQFIDLVEFHFRELIENAALDIVNFRSNCKIIFIAGPSSSGKTTFAKLLSKNLEEHGIGAVSMSLDDFYLGVEQAPLLPDGTRDLECIEAIDAINVDKCLSDIVNLGYCYKPIFDFTLQRPRDEKEKFVVYPDQVVIVEGIHALNPIISYKLPKESYMMTYISVGRHVTDMDRIIFSRSDIRFLRRMLRDKLSRNTSFSRTLNVWRNVCDGEIKYLRPYRSMCDMVVDSFHSYEPALMRSILYPMLEDSELQATSNNHFMSRIKAGLERFEPMDTSLIPENSLLREFCGSC